jgi:hypothetical protein
MSGRGVRPHPEGKLIPVVIGHGEFGVFRAQLPHSHANPAASPGIGVLARRAPQRKLETAQGGDSPPEWGG